jgi:hypothetical protein
VAAQLLVQAGAGVRDVAVHLVAGGHRAVHRFHQPPHHVVDPVAVVLEAQRRLLDAALAVHQGGAVERAGVHRRLGGRPAQIAGRRRLGRGPGIGDGRQRHVLGVDLLGEPVPAGPRLPVAALGLDVLPGDRQVHHVASPLCLAGSPAADRRAFTKFAAEGHVASMFLGGSVITCVIR